MVEITEKEKDYMRKCLKIGDNRELNSIQHVAISLLPLEKPLPKNIRSYVPDMFKEIHSHKSKIRGQITNILDDEEQTTFKKLYTSGIYRK